MLGFCYYTHYAYVRSGQLAKQKSLTQRLTASLISAMRLWMKWLEWPFISFGPNWSETQVIHGHLVGQPDTIVCTVEKEAIIVHAFCVNGKNDRFAVPFANLPSRRLIG